MDVWQRAVDNERFNPAFRSDEWRSRITGGHPERVVLTYVGRLGAGVRLYSTLLHARSSRHRSYFLRTEFPSAFAVAPV